MSRKSLNHRVLGLILAVAWMLGPCHVGALGVVLMAVSDGSHEMILSEGDEETDITLKHQRDGLNAQACPAGHHHSAMVAWLLKGQESRNGQHPDHHLTLHHGKAIGSKDKNAVALSDIDSTTNLPADTVLVLAGSPLPRINQAPRYLRAAPRRHIPQDPPRASVLRI